MIGDVDSDFLGLEKVGPFMKKKYDQGKEWLSHALNKSYQPPEVTTVRDAPDVATLKEIIAKAAEIASNVSTGINVVNSQYVNNEAIKAKQEADKIAKDEANKKAGNIMLYGSIGLVVILVVVFILIKRNTRTE